MGRFLIQPEDLNRQRLKRDMQVMLFALNDMHADLTRLEDAVAARQRLRQKNFLDSGGDAAFTPEELGFHATEADRLAGYAKVAADMKTLLTQASSILVEAGVNE